MIRWPAVLVALVAACSTDSATPADRASRPPVTAAARPITPRAKLPAAIQPLLPRHGVYVAGGGTLSSSWRVVVDVDAKTIYGGSTAKPSSPSFGPMDKTATKILSPRNEELLMKLAHDAWSEPAPNDSPSPTADYDEIFVVLEGDETFYLQGFGPIRRPGAANAIVELRAAAGL